MGSLEAIWKWVQLEAISVTPSPLYSHVAFCYQTFHLLSHCTHLSPLPFGEGEMFTLHFSVHGVANSILVRCIYFHFCILLPFHIFFWLSQIYWPNNITIFLHLFTFSSFIDYALILFLRTTCFKKASPAS